MQATLLIMASTVCAADPVAEPVVHASVTAAASALAPQLETGSLLFSDGKSLAVKAVSWSQYTHVATVVRQQGQVYVYESQNDVGVHRLRLADYMASVVGEQVEVLEPDRAFGEKRAGRYREYLISQLGRPYAVMHFLTGTRCEGLHCAEYVTNALIRINLITAESPSYVSPASLREGLLSSDLYEVTGRFTVRRPEPRQPAGGSWGEALWRDTKGCWNACWSSVRGCIVWD